MTDPLSQRVAANVRAELARRQKQQRDLAGVLGISIAQVSERLAGRTPFRLDELEPVAEMFGLPVTALLAAQPAGIAA
jgi:transcriptional regulator with XRE-family HTH domain